MVSTAPTVVVAGVGRFGVLHVRVWTEAGAHVAGVVDPDMARAREVADGYGVSVVGDHLAAVLEQISPDIVVIASTEATHVDLARQALDAGAHVFVEKPLALSSVDAWELGELAHRTGREVVAGHISRFALPYRRMRQRIERGDIGTLSALRLRRDFSRDWFYGFGDRVDPLWESAIHDIDLAISMVRRPAASVTALSSGAAGELAPAVVSALVAFEGGCIATIETAWLIPPTAPATLAGALQLEGSIVAESEALGTEGVLRQRLLSEGLVEWTADGSYVPDLWLWPEEDGRIGGALRTEVDHALALFAGRADVRLMPLEEACWGVEIAEAMIQSIEQGKTVDLRPGRQAR